MTTVTTPAAPAVDQTRAAIAMADPDAPHPDPDAPVPYWPAYLPTAPEPAATWLTPRGEAALDLAADIGPGYEWYREMEAG